MGYEDYQRTYNPQAYYGGRPARRRPRFGTSTKEILHILVATAGLSTALFIWFEKTEGIFVFGFEDMALAGKIGLAVAITASGFILHELGHKLTAQHYGHWSEFRANPVGLIAAIAFAYLIGFIIALPGATWHTASSRAENGKVSAMGPLINVLVMLAAFPFVPAPGTTARTAGDYIAIAVVFFNGILAIFNLIPFGPLDGKKVLRWNPIFYLVLLGLAVGAFVFTGASHILFAPKP